MKGFQKTQLYFAMCDGEIQGSFRCYRNENNVQLQKSKLNAETLGVNRMILLILFFNQFNTDHPKIITLDQDSCMISKLPNPNLIMALSSLTNHA
jgi:hypothetical protein